MGNEERETPFAFMRDEPAASDMPSVSLVESLSAPAQFTLIYESRDKRFCLFEDAAGHLTSVRASRLA